MGWDAVTAGLRFRTLQTSKCNLQHPYKNLYHHYMSLSADEYGLVGVGGDLEPETLLTAYRNGIFPWFNSGMPICWWCPDPRAIFEIELLRPSKTIAKVIRKGRFRCTLNQAFEEVVGGCSVRAEDTWLVPAMKQAYLTLHRMGHAHSVETWNGDALVGGLYGVALGGAFVGESMFHRESNASKVAFYFLLDHLRSRGFTLLDAQILNDHTRRLGAINIPREEYLRRLTRALKQDIRFIP